MLIIEQSKQLSSSVEMVELKGDGHPDTICDTVCEAASQALSQYYLKHFGHVLHHNVDKGLLIAGKAEPAFGGGKILQSTQIIIAGRATKQMNGRKIPVEKIVIPAAQEVLKGFPLGKFIIKAAIKPGAANLINVPVKHVANDTSFGVAHYPYTPLEQLVLSIKQFLNALRKGEKSIGFDIKIMASRIGNKSTITLAIAFIAKHIKSMKHYIATKQRIQKILERKFHVSFFVNTLDDYTSKDAIYLTVSGLSAEQGDDGQVGRGNRYNGLITPYKPMSLEAVAGKNVYHPGKLYQILAFILAQDLVKAGAQYAEVKLLSQVGMSLDVPAIVHVSLQGRVPVKKIVEKRLYNLPALYRQIIG